MQRFVEVAPFVRAGRGMVRVQLVDLGLDGMTQLVDPVVQAFSPEVAYAYAEALMAAADEVVSSEPRPAEVLSFRAPA